MEPTLRSETSAFILQTLGKFPKEHRLHSKHGESLKTTSWLDVLTNIHQTCVVYCNIFNVLYKKVCYFLSYGFFFVTEQGVISILFILAIIVVGHDKATKTTKLSVKLHPCKGAKCYLIEMHRHNLFVGLNNTTCVRTCFDFVWMCDIGYVYLIVFI